MRYVCFIVLKNNVLFQFEIEGFRLIDKFLLQYSGSIGQEIEKKENAAHSSIRNSSNPVSDLGGTLIKFYKFVIASTFKQSSWAEEKRYIRTRRKQNRILSIILLSLQREYLSLIKSANARLTNY